MQFSEISTWLPNISFPPFSEEKLCPLRASIDVLEGEYFFLCYLESRQEHFQEEAYAINWYKESAGKQQLIKDTHRIVSQMNFLEFWPAELSDSGNYSVIHRTPWVKRRDKDKPSLFGVNLHWNTLKGTKSKVCCMEFL